MWEVVTAIGNDIRSDRQEVLGGWIGNCQIFS
jgi:hypothetical protein